MSFNKVLILFSTLTLSLAGSQDGFAPCVIRAPKEIIKLIDSYVAKEEDVTSLYTNSENFISQFISPTDEIPVSLCFLHGLTHAGFKLYNNLPLSSTSIGFCSGGLLIAALQNYTWNQAQIQATQRSLVSPTLQPDDLRVNGQNFIVKYLSDSTRSEYIHREFDQSGQLTNTSENPPPKPYFDLPFLRTLLFTSIPWVTYQDTSLANIFNRVPSIRQMDDSQLEYSEVKLNENLPGKTVLMHRPSQHHGGSFLPSKIEIWHTPSPLQNAIALKSEKKLWKTLTAGCSSVFCCCRKRRHKTA